MRFSDHRRQYTLGGLRRADLAEDPVAQFVAWQDQVIAAGLADPTALRRRLHRCLGNASDPGGRSKETLLGPDGFHPDRAPPDVEGPFAGSAKLEYRRFEVAQKRRSSYECDSWKSADQATASCGAFFIGRP